MKKQQNDKGKSSRQQEADALVAELNSAKLSDKELNEKIYQRSEHPQYRLQGGYLDPICVSCVNSPLQDVEKKIKLAKLGEFIQIKRPNGLWVLRKIKQYTIEADEIAEKFESLYRKTTRILRHYAKKDECLWTGV